MVRTAILLLLLLLLGGLPAPGALPGTAFPLGWAPAGARDAALGSNDVAAIVVQLKKERDEADPDLIGELAAAGTREAAQGLIEVHDVMGSILMQREVLRALARFDGVPEAEQLALQKIADVATQASEPELHEEAVDLLGRSPSLGKHFLERIIDSPAEDAVRERAMRRHVESATEADLEFYRRMFAEPEPEKGRKGTKKGAELEKKIAQLTAIREMAFERIASTLDARELVERAEEKARDANAPRLGGIRRIALEELSRRGERKAKAVAEDMLKDVTESGRNRALAARVLADLEGDKAAPAFIDWGTRDRSMTPLELRHALADLLAGMDEPGLDRKVIKLVGKNRPLENIFALRALRGVSDDRLVRDATGLLEDSEPEVQIAAAEFLGSLGDPAAAAALGELLRSSPNDTVVTAAMEAISELRGEDPAWREELVRYAAGKRTQVRNAAIAELARRDARGSVPVLVEALSHPDWSTRYAALRGLAAARTPEAIGAIVERMDEESGFLAHRFAEVLWKLTGQPHRTNAKAWQAWWAKEGGPGFEPISAEELAEREAAEEKRRLAQTTRATSFFGIRVLSHRAIFVLDVSGSMAEPTRGEFVGQKGTPRIDVAKRELIKSIEALDPAALFNVIVFSSDVGRWLDGGVSTASGASKAEAVAWVERLREGGGTNLYGALREAFSDPDADTIFVLSDGEPSVGDVTDPYQIRQRVQQWNEHRKIQIHTVSVGGSLRVLDWLAEDSGGKNVHFD